MAAPLSACLTIMSLLFARLLIASLSLCVKRQVFDNIMIEVYKEQQERDESEQDANAQADEQASNDRVFLFSFR